MSTISRDVFAASFDARVDVGLGVTPLTGSAASFVPAFAWTLCVDSSDQGVAGCTGFLGDLPPAPDRSRAAPAGLVTTRGGHSVCELLGERSLELWGCTSARSSGRSGAPGETPTTSDGGCVGAGADVGAGAGASAGASARVVGDGGEVVGDGSTGSEVAALISADTGVDAGAAPGDTGLRCASACTAALWTGGTG